ncbi:MAG TPA: peptidylprolyl isomerase [Magnetospirillaceae bacterium]|jgi:peptidyl-prolyl cis-trans isomerase C
MTFSRLRAAALTIALIAATPVFAADSKSDDPVVATVNGLPIHKSTLVEAYQHSRLSQAPIDAVYPQLLDYVITSQLLLNEAKKSNLAEDPEVKAQVKLAQDNILEQAYIEKKIAAAVTDAAIQKQYDETIKKQPGKEEVHARHILLDNEADAKKVIADIKGGAKFEDIAKTKSKDPSAAQNAGDLGFFSKEDMVPEFADAAFKMKPGEVSETPIKTQFGWHVIQVLERRTAPPPSLEDSKAQISNELRNNAAQTIIAGLQKDATIQRFSIDGSPLPAEKADDKAAPAAAAPAAGDKKPDEKKQ